MEKILVTPRSFAKTDPRPFEMLQKAGYEIVRNPGGAILSKEEMMAYIAGAVGVVVGVDPLDREVIDAAPNLRAIAKYGVGVDNIDVAYAEERGIAVSRTIGANAEAVADYAFALMLALARQIPYANSCAHAKDWRPVRGLDVFQKTIGILGVGAIGRGIARRARGFDMSILAYDLVRDDDFAKEYGVRYLPVADILKQADFLTLHLPLTDATENIIDAAALKTMKRNAVLVNTARGGLVDEAALVSALRAGEIYGAALDVFRTEPPEEPSLFIPDNLLLSAHAAAATDGAASEMGRMAAENLLRDLKNSKG